MTTFRFKNYLKFFPRLLQFLLVFCTLVLVGEAIAARPDSSGSGGGSKKSSSDMTTLPLSLVSEDVQFQGSNGDDSCITEDDYLYWQAEGYLDPGETFTYAPPLPACDGYIAAISVSASWSGSGMEIKTIVPDTDMTSDNLEQQGMQLYASPNGTTAQLCMFPHFLNGSRDYTISITNRSAEPITGIRIRGRSENDWPYLFYSSCFEADGDNDGWNDSLEHTMSLMVYPIGYIDGVYQKNILRGSDYLKSIATSGDGFDEIDGYPADFNDDGAVDAEDLAILSGYLGEGNGIPLETITPNRDTAGFWNNVFPWRRYDLDADGYVGDEDAEIVEALIGKPVPMQKDILFPTARITYPTEGQVLVKGQYLQMRGHAWDNLKIARVDYLVDGRVACTATSGATRYPSQSPFYQCGWTLSKRNGSYELQMKIWDHTGNYAESDIVHVTAQ